MRDPIPSFYLSICHLPLAHYFGWVSIVFNKRSSLSVISAPKATKSSLWNSENLSIWELLGYFRKLHPHTPYVIFSTPKGHEVENQNNHICKEVIRVWKRRKNKQRAINILGLTKTGPPIAFQNPSKKTETLGLYLVLHWMLLATAGQALPDQPVECQPPPGAQSWVNTQTQMTVRPETPFQISFLPQKVLTPLEAGLQLTHSTSAQAEAITAEQSPCRNCKKHCWLTAYSIQAINIFYLYGNFGFH